MAGELTTNKMICESYELIVWLCIDTFYKLNLHVFELCHGDRVLTKFVN